MPVNLGERSNEVTIKSTGNISETVETNHLLGEILIELKILNAYHAEMTDELITEEEIEDEYN